MQIVFRTGEPAVPDSLNLLLQGICLCRTCLKIMLYILLKDCMCLKSQF